MMLPRSRFARSLALAGALTMSAAGCKSADPNSPATWIAKLEDKEPRKVAEALNQLRKMNAKESVNAIIPKLQVEDGDVREAAAYALMEFGDKSALTPLTEAIDLTATFRGADRANAKIAEALGSFEDTRATGALLKMTKSKSDLVKLKAVEALGKVRDEKSIPALIKFVDDANTPPLITKSAIVALGNLKATEAVPALTKALVVERKGISFVLEASYALLQLAPSSTTALTSIMAGEDKAFATWAEENKRQPAGYVAKAAMVLGDLSDKAAVPVLTKALTWKDPGDNSVYEELARAHVAEALGRMRVKEAAPIIANQLGGIADANMRAKYATALAQIGEKSVLPKMEAAVKDKKATYTARGETLTGLAMLGDGKYKALFESLQKTDNPAALTAQCIKEEGEAAKPTCEKMFGQWGKLLEEELPRLMAGEECKDDVGCWMVKLKDPTWKIRERAAYELGRSGRPQAVEKLLEATKDEDTRVRRAVYIALDWATQFDATGAMMNKAADTLAAQLAEEATSTKTQIVNEDLKRVVFKAKTR